MRPFFNQLIFASYGIPNAIPYYTDLILKKHQVFFSHLVDSAWFHCIIK